MATPTYFTPTEADMEAVHYGVTLAPIGEDGDLIALGHVEPRRALAAFNWYARTVCGLLNYLDDRSATVTEALATISHVSMVFSAPDPAEGDDPDWRWVAEELVLDSSGSTPCTYAHLA